ncbi:hypothetical protein [Nocardiopsis sp. NRRL B-16309]|uniref:hypothetical protein n=1 Tax=Nocardiopsis sp. NRRL B-16309 TaxID=1519494 RepID=UPI0006AFFFC5|nr:hypothetical protein [Nocardiopsis sp. NRRL B-16309]KOX19050.1 hypothetical protein ADL05_06110 [Nocardiopsis sp. NRRL B-16309]
MSLEEQARAELLAVRKTAAGLTVDTMAQSPVICGLLGDGDPLSAYNTLKHKVLSTDADMSMKAALASLGFTSDQQTHLGRLDEFGAEHSYEQRQVRRYSDKGVRQLAKLITTNWITEAVPCLDVACFQVAPERFLFVTQARSQYFVEMRPIRVVLYQGKNGPKELDLQAVERQEGIWNHVDMDPIRLQVTDEETSLVWVWRGELWPKFAVQWCMDVQGVKTVSEGCGNKMRLRLLIGTV